MFYMKLQISHIINNSVYIIILNIIAVIAILNFSISTLPNLTDFNIILLYYIEIITILIFTIDYILQTISGGIKYTKSFFGVIDFIVILPFYLSIGNGSVLRILKLMRLFKALKMKRCTDAILLIKNSLLLIKSELLIFGLLTLMFLFLVSVGMYYAEHDAQPDKFISIFHSFWWAIITLTTVGYGDIVPITTLGKILTGGILFLGLAIIAIPTSLFSAAIIEIRNKGKLK